MSRFKRLIPCVSNCQSDSDDETSSAMALHETPMLRSPPGVDSGSRLAPRAEPEDEYLEDDDFEDAVEQLSSEEPSISLQEALSDCQRAITLFFNNDLAEAVAIMTPWKQVSLYHAHGAAIFEFIPALLTLEPSQIQRAQDALRHTFHLCSRERKNYTFVQSIGAIIKKPNYAGYTEEEAHAELIYSEAMLLSACLNTLEGEEMSSFLRASMRVKTSYNGYRTCAKILEKKLWVDEQSRLHFESGVRLGIATFNVMIAMLPPRIISLLEFVGFSADKNVTALSAVPDGSNLFHGLISKLKLLLLSTNVVVSLSMTAQRAIHWKHLDNNECEKGREELMVGATSPGLRSVLCQLTLLIYYLVIGQFAAIPPDYIAAETLIITGLREFPNSVWFTMFKARMQMLRGMIEESVVTYQTATATTDMWPQLKHLTYWEMIWALAMMMKWEEAARYALYLTEHSKWSKTIYVYTEAAMTLERGHLLSIDARKRAAELVMQKILGRSLPMEKFVIRRCERWSRRGYLVLPGVELICLWHIFPHLAAEPHYADRMLKLIEQTNDEIYNVIHSKHGVDAATRYTPAYDLDDLALVRFLRGSLLAAMSLPRLAIRHLEGVLKMKDDIKDNTYLLPYATVEIAMCHYGLGDRYKAVELLQDARKKYSGYLLESRLHFRIHAKLELIHAGVQNNVVAGTTAGEVTLASVNALKAGTSMASWARKPGSSTDSGNKADGDTSSDKADSDNKAGGSNGADAGSNNNGSS